MLLVAHVGAGHDTHLALREVAEGALERFYVHVHVQT